MSKIENIKVWYEFNKEIIIIVIVGIMIITLNAIIKNKTRSIDFKSYDSEVEIIHLEFKKLYKNPSLYSTEIKLDKIVFDLEYKYKKRTIKTTSILFSEYISPQFERNIDLKDMNKIKVKCKTDSPNEAIVVNRN